MLICFHGIDHQDAGELRAALRPAHLEFQSQRNNLVAGPLLDGTGAMCGSMIVFEALDIADATTQMAGDPYITGELFQTISINEFIAADWPAPTADHQTHHVTGGPPAGGSGEHTTPDRSGLSAIQS